MRRALIIVTLIVLYAAPLVWDQGVLRRSAENPRYMSDGVTTRYRAGGNHDAALVGWLDPPDGLSADFPFPTWVSHLQSLGHNHMRAWMHDSLFQTPLPWQRSATGPASNLGGNRLNFSQFNDAFFTQVRNRIIALNNAGIAVQLVFFEGAWNINDHWNTHFFNPANNTAGINGNMAEVYTLNNSAVTTVQENYVKRMIDELNDLDLLTFEMNNEVPAPNLSATVAWVEHMVNVVKTYEQTKSKQHLVGVSCFAGFASSIATLQNIKGVDFIAPCPDAGGFSDPAAVGTTGPMYVTDGDHLNCANCGGQDWVWKAFTRGHNLGQFYFWDPNGVDQFPDVDWDPGLLEPQTTSRRAFGQTVSYAARMDMGATVPSGGLSSTGYALAKPGAHYLAYRPGNTGNVTINMQPGTYQREWMNINTGAVTTQANLVVGSLGGNQNLTSPISGAPAVVFLTAEPAMTGAITEFFPVCPENPSRAQAALFGVSRLMLPIVHSDDGDRPPQELPPRIRAQVAAPGVARVCPWPAHGGCASDDNTKSSWSAGA